MHSNAFKCIQMFNIGKKSFVLTICHELFHISAPFHFFGSPHFEIRESEI